MFEVSEIDRNSRLLSALASLLNIVVFDLLACFLVYSRCCSRRVLWLLIYFVDGPTLRATIIDFRMNATSTSPRIRGTVLFIVVYLTLSWL